MAQLCCTACGCLGQKISDRTPYLLITQLKNNYKTIPPTMLEISTLQLTFDYKHGHKKLL